MQDRGEAPPDPVYGKVLAGLHLVSCYAAIPLLDALLTWRKESLKAAARAPELVVLRKRVSPPPQLLLEVVPLDRAVQKFASHMQFCCHNAQVLPGTPSHHWTATMQKHLRRLRLNVGSLLWRQSSLKPLCSLWRQKAARSRMARPMQWKFWSLIGCCMPRSLWTPSILSCSRPESRWASVYFHSGIYSIT